jgi:hypothetical protein
MVGGVGFSAAAPPVREDCEVISVPYLARRASRHADRRAIARQTRELSAIGHSDKNHRLSRGFCRFAFRKWPRLRSSRFPQASLLGERINGCRKVSNASAASRSQPLLTPVILSFLKVGSTRAFSAISNRSAVNGPCHLFAHRPRSPGARGRSVAATKQTWAMRSASARKDLSSSCAACDPTVGSIDRRFATRDATAISRSERTPVSSPPRSRETSLRSFAISNRAFATSETSSVPAH